MLAVMKALSLMGMLGAPICSAPILEPAPCARARPRTSGLTDAGPIHIYWGK
jgi:hypothetical protein